MEKVMPQKLQEKLSSKETVFVVEDSYTLPDGTVIVGKVINKSISKNGAFALSDADRTEACSVFIKSMKRDGKPKIIDGLIGETLHITLGGVSNSHEVKNGMILSRRRRGVLEAVFEFIVVILSHFP